MCSPECRICGSVASGLHYGVLTCEGCKVFFKRYMGKYQHYRCFFGDDCVINLQTRSRCKTCRYKKCVKEGMSVDAIYLGRTPKNRKTISGTDLSLQQGSFGVRSNISRPSGQTSVIVLAPRRTYVDKMGGLTGDVSRDRGSTFCGDVESFNCEPSCGSQLVRRVPPPRSLLSFSDENLDFMLSDFVGDFVRPCRLPDIAMPRSSEVQPVLAPSMLQKYWGVMNSRCDVLEDSIKTVVGARNDVFGARIRYHLDFVERCYGRGLVPFEPQCTLERMLWLVQASISDFADRLVRFMVLLPGFTDINQADRDTILQDHWLATWLIAWSFCYRDGECYIPMGPDGVHHSTYWMGQISDPFLFRFVFSVTSDINDLELTMTERFLFLTVAVFRLDSEDTVKDKRFIDFLYSHYLDALLHLIGHGRGNLMTRLRAVIKRISIVNKVHRRYVLVGNVTQAPFGGADSDLIINLDPDSFARTDFYPVNF